MRTVRVDVAKAAGELELLLGRLRRRLRAEAPNEGLTLSQMAVLKHLQQSGPETASGLAAIERVRPQSMSATLSTLDDEGFIERKADPNDRRQILISSTERGLKIVDTARRYRGEWLARAIATCFDRDEQKILIEAVHLLDRLVDCDAVSSPAKQPSKHA